MRKKSHISLSNYLVLNMEKQELNKHRKAFYIGSIQPDCVPSFITRRHSIEDTFHIVAEEIKYLVNGFDLDEGINRKFCRHLGIVTHYIADYFTFPHNKTFEGNIKEHCKYEEVLKRKLKKYVLSQSSMRKRTNDVTFNSAEDIINFISTMHAKYINSMHNMKEDINYIVDICFQVVDAILRLVEIEFRQRKYAKGNIISYSLR